jgi:hypothetical protein
MMASSSRQQTLAKDAIEVVVRRLSTLSSTPEVEELRERAEDYLREVDGWQTARPTPEELENLMKGVLGLHTAVAKLEREWHEA